MRLFVAVSLPEHIRTHLMQVSDILRWRYPGGIFTEAQNLHLTLAFIGETENIAAARAAIDEVDMPAFNIGFEGFGRFGDIYWAGVKRSFALEELAESVQRELRSRGFHIERRKFKPHISLARKLPVSAPADFKAPEGEMPVERVSLMDSQRIDGRIVYSEIYGKTLA